MKPITRWIVVAIFGLVLVAAPTLVRNYWLGYGERPYQPPAITPALNAVTPLPTVTPMLAALPPDAPDNEVMRGPVVVDLAHFSQVERNKFQPLAAALSASGVNMRFWLPSVPINEIQGFADFPDLSAELQAQLENASALVVVSPFFLYNDKEIAIVEKFVADGGRLLLISDPDIEGDAAQDTNLLAAPFNLVFNDDYLYDTVDNDENYTFFFQGDFLDQAEALAGDRIAFYGGRSISGALLPQVRSASTTISSLRNGASGFTTVALGGQTANDSLGRVLALSDFDVLTDPYVDRHDNRHLLSFVTDFLTGAQRQNTLVDFPAFLGKQVALASESSEPVGADGVTQAAELQRSLEASGRELRLAASDWLSETIAEPPTDVIYLASYEAPSATMLLDEMGISLVEEIVTPTVAATTTQTVTATLTPTPDPAATPEADVEAELEEVTPASLPLPPTESGELPISSEEPVPAQQPTPEITATATEIVTTTATEQTDRTETPAPTATPLPPPTPSVERYLVQKDGIRLRAGETQLFVQRPYGETRLVLAVLGDNSDAVSGGLKRLIDKNFAGCLVQQEVVICPVDGIPEVVDNETTDKAEATPTLTEATPAATTSPEPTPDGGTETTSVQVLVVDDNRTAPDGEKGEALLYESILSASGYEVEVWSTREQDFPNEPKLASATWIIWSDAEYSTSGISGESLRLIGAAVNEGGNVLVSSRMPFFGVGSQAPSPIADLVIADGVPELVKDLPETAIKLPAGLPAVVPLEGSDEPSTGGRTAMQRGPASEDTGAPVLMLYTDENFEEPKGALLMLLGMSITWLPEDVSIQLVQNMADVMLTD